MSGLMLGDAGQLRILLTSRLPRLLAILCTGMGMSVAGLIMQQLCMNRFVSPTTGATISCAQLGVLLAYILTPSALLWQRTAFASVTAIAGTWVFVWFIQRIRFKDVVMVPLVGIMFGNVVSGVTSFLAYRHDLTQALSTWVTGSFSLVLSGRYELVLLVVPLLVVAFVFANQFNIVGMGRDFSRNLGVPYHVVLIMGLTIAALITASVVVTVGSISYIGLIVPNLVALFKGDRIRGTLVDTALFGALFVLVCDMIARTVIAPYELPIELIVGIIGSVVFIVMLLYRLNHGRRSIAPREFLRRFAHMEPLADATSATATDTPTPMQPTGHHIDDGSHGDGVPDAPNGSRTHDRAYGNATPRNGGRLRSGDIRRAGGGRPDGTTATAARTSAASVTIKEAGDE